MSTPSATAHRSPMREDWHRLAGTWSVLLHATGEEAQRVAGGAPYILAPADAVDPLSLLGRVVHECESRWGAPPDGEAVPICPHLHASLNKRALWIGSVPTMPDPLALKTAFVPLLDLFGLLEAVSGTRLTSLIVVVPFTEPAHGSAIVEAAHREIKSLAMERGLLPGEFGRTLAGPGSRYRHLATRKSEVCEYLALRRLLRQDRKYCENDPKWLARYELMFGKAS